MLAVRGCGGGAAVSQVLGGGVGLSVLVGSTSIVCCWSDALGGCYRSQISSPWKC